ncbi:deaminase domain-containing protein [Acetivibrio clariflavus]|uniref:deaminase domain-containing protein n=1 Tax=Acetivibrio clariflavus TaxID=288965 RepID=UPI000684F6AE|nr:deaminase domain-containing protein [Acetivibrio clariflavus]
MDFIAYSSTSDIPGLVPYIQNEADRLFTTYFVKDANRAVDTEAKILEQIASELGAAKSADGNINWGSTSSKGIMNLFTELEPCPSCYGVMQQFRKHYPNITINIIWKYPYIYE